MVDTRRDAARKVARFRENIAQRVSAECDAITKGIDALRVSELSSYRSYGASLEYSKLEDEKRKLSSAYQREIANRKHELRAEFSARREELRSALFDAVRQRLQAFADSGEYSGWLLKKAEPYRALTLYVRTEDVAKLPGFSVQADPNRTPLGGFTAVGDGTSVDETLDRLLSEQEEWFLETFASAT